MRYHHVGIPTFEVRGGETYLPELGMYVSGFESSEFGVEWMRFTLDSPIPKLVQTVPHVAFVVENGAPIEFLQRADGARAHDRGGPEGA